MFELLTLCTHTCSESLSPFIPAGQCAGSSHRDTIQLLQQETPDFIGPNLWPPNCPNLNPVDYKICGVMQQRVYERRRMNNVDELKQHLIAVWHSMQQNVIDSAVV